MNDNKEPILSPPPPNTVPEYKRTIRVSQGEQIRFDEPENEDNKSTIIQIAKEESKQKQPEKYYISETNQIGKEFLNFILSSVIMLTSTIFCIVQLSRGSEDRLYQDILLLLLGYVLKSSELMNKKN